jgi:hypothetical protein
LALEESETVVTANERDFGRVPGLGVEQLDRLTGDTKPVVGSSHFPRKSLIIS